jgi:transcriptional regulator
MYIPRLNKVEDRETIRKFVSDVGFATLVTPSGSGLNGLKVTHLPLLYVDSPGEGVISGHMAKADDHWKAFDGETESVVIFQGPNAYVSLEWYESKPAVPTWNYSVVHMRGAVTAIHDPEWLIGHVDELVDFHEVGIGDGSKEASYEGIRDKLLGGIVGFHMAVETVEAKFKMSENRSEEDRRRVAEKLGSSGVVRLLDLSEGVPLQPNLLLMEKELWGRTSVWLPLLRGCRILLRWGRIPTTSGLLECLHRV